MRAAVFGLRPFRLSARWLDWGLRLYFRHSLLILKLFLNVEENHASRIAIGDFFERAQ